VSDIDPRLEAALRLIFFPFARLLLRNGLGVKPVIRILKEAFVDAAITEHGRNGKPASITRASEIIGLTRKETRTIRNELSNMPRYSTYDSDIYGADVAMVLAHWNATSMFANDRGLPKVLEAGPGPGTFADLVEQSTGVTSFQDVLRRLEDRGCVAVDNDGQISLIKRDWNVSSDLPRLLRDTLGTLASTVNRNSLLGPENGLTQRIAFTMKAHPDKMAVCQRMLRSRIIRFIEEVDDQVTAIEVQEGEPGCELGESELGKFGVGAYLFVFNTD